MEKKKPKQNRITKTDVNELRENVLYSHVLPYVPSGVIS